MSEHPLQVFRTDISKTAMLLSYRLIMPKNLCVSVRFFIHIHIPTHCLDVETSGTIIGFLLLSSSLEHILRLIPKFAYKLQTKVNVKIKSDASFLHKFWSLRLFDVLIPKMMPICGGQPSLT